MKETKNYFLILLMIAAFAVFNPSPEIPEGKVAGQIVSGTEKFAEVSSIISFLGLVSVTYTSLGLAIVKFASTNTNNLKKCIDKAIEICSLNNENNNLKVESCFYVI